MTYCQCLSSTSLHAGQEGQEMTCGHFEPPSASVAGKKIMAALPSLCRHAEAFATLGSPTHGIFSLQKGARFNAAVAQNSVDFQRVEQGFGVELLYITIINGIVEYSQYSSIGTIRGVLLQPRSQTVCLVCCSGPRDHNLSPLSGRL